MRQDSSPPKHSEPRIETRCFSWVAFRGAKAACSIRGSPSDWECESDLSDFHVVRQDFSPTEQGFAREITDISLPVHTITATSTASPTSSLRPTPTATVTPTSTITPTSECTNTLRFVTLAYLNSGIQLSYDTPYDLSRFVVAGKLTLSNLKVCVNGRETLDYAVDLAGIVFVLGK